MRDTFKVTFHKTAYINGRGNSWAEYDWDPGRECWFKRDGNGSEGFFIKNPEFEQTMSDEKMTFYSLK